MMSERYTFRIKDSGGEYYQCCVDADLDEVILTISDEENEWNFTLGSQEHLNLMTGFEKVTTILRESMYRYNAQQLQCRDAIVERKEE